MQHVWKKGAAVGFLVLLGLWLVGGGRGWAGPYPPPAPSWELSAGEQTFSNAQGVANNRRQIGMGKAPLPALLDQADVDRIQVHEKTAYLTNGTAVFEDDEGQIRALLTAHQAVVFNERS